MKLVIRQFVDVPKLYTEPLTEYLEELANGSGMRMPCMNFGGHVTTIDLGSDLPDVQSLLADFRQAISDVKNNSRSSSARLDESLILSLLKIYASRYPKHVVNYVDGTRKAYEFGYDGKAPSPWHLGCKLIPLQGSYIYVYDE